MSTNRPLIALIDGYSSAHLLPYWFRTLGYDCLHVPSSEYIWNKLGRQIWRADYRELLPVVKNADEHAVVLREHNVHAVVPGYETSVEYADLLSERLNLRTNGTALSAARRNKFELSNRLRECGLNCIRSTELRSIVQVNQWSRANDRWPVVVKPIASAGGDGVIVCQRAPEVMDAATDLLGATNRLGMVNGSILAQEYVQGHVFSVNTVSCGGRHYVAHIWEYRKSELLYDHEYLVPRFGPVQDRIVACALDALNALEISFGAAHIEIIDSANGPVVVDFGARLHGCDSPRITRVCTGIGQDELTACAYVAPDEFARRTQEPYEIYMHLMTVDFISRREGVVRSLAPFEELRKLPSFYALRLDIGIGDKLEITNDLFTSPGLVELVHRDFAQLEHDRDTVRRVERSGMYDQVTKGEGAT